MPPAFNLEPGSNSSVQSNKLKFTDGRFSTSADCSIFYQCVALIPFATKLLSHQDTHTYRLSNLLKISAAPFRFDRQQQRSEIMKHSLHPVKQFRKVFTTTRNFCYPHRRKTRRCRRGAHYIDTKLNVKRFFETLYIHRQMGNELRIWKDRIQPRHRSRPSPILPRAIVQNNQLPIHA